GKHVSRTRRLAMVGINRIGVESLLVVAFFAGCSSGSRDASTTASAVGNDQSTQADTPVSPIAKAASDWLDAVLKGDKQRASARLTPQARQQIIKNDMEFSPPGGIQTPRFQIGEVRTPAQDQAIVQ